MEPITREWQRITHTEAQIYLSEKLNCHRRINKFLEETNNKLPKGGLLIGSADTLAAWKKRAQRKILFPFNAALYLAYFATQRCFPKLHRKTAALYFKINGGKNRALSKAEILGRLCSCGFAIEYFEEQDGTLTFIARKIASPSYNMKPSYWPVFHMPRIGKGGKIIRVYKFRTMHPYSEYLQDFLLVQNGLDKGGKFREDFRIPAWGRLLRKYWIDELPMIANWIGGDLKLVGVRPLSFHYFNLYHSDLKSLRLLTKPGLIPPYYADMPGTLDEIMESERKYLQSYLKNPFLTDVKYLGKSIYNIVIRRVRSK